MARKTLFSERIRNSIIDVIVELRRHNTPISIELACTTEEELNIIPKAAAAATNRDVPGEVRMILCGRLVRRTPALLEVMCTMLQLMPLANVLVEQLNQHLDLIDLTKVLSAWQMAPETSDEPSSPVIFNN